MAMMLHHIKISGSYSVEKLLDYHLIAKVNEHTYVHYTGVVDEATAHAITNQQNRGTVTIENTMAEDGLIFQGYPLKVKVIEKNGVFSLTVLCVSYSYLLDVKGNSRSFQDTEKTYAEILTQVYDSAENASVITTAGINRKISPPIFQYEETDWQFTLRMAGRIRTIVAVNHKADFAQVCYGVPKRQAVTQNLIGKTFEMGRHLRKWLSYKSLNVNDKDLYYLDMKQERLFLNPEDFDFCSIDDAQQVEIGDTVVIDGKQFIVMEQEMTQCGGIVCSHYVFGKELGFSAPYINNTHLHGLALIGTVLDTADERMQLHLDIDATQDKEKAYWFSYLPAQGNTMYCMPQNGAKAILSFQGERDDSALVTLMYRMNGDQCSDMSDYNQRYFTTEFQKRLAMLQETMFFTGGSNLVQLEDQIGVFAETKQCVVISARDNIEIHSKTKVTVDTPEHIYMTMTGTESVIDMAGSEINVQSDHTVIHSTANNE